MGSSRGSRGSSGNSTIGASTETAVGEAVGVVEGTALGAAAGALSEAAVGAAAGVVARTALGVAAGASTEAAALAAARVVLEAAAAVSADVVSGYYRRTQITLPVCMKTFECLQICTHIRVHNHTHTCTFAYI